MGFIAWDGFAGSAVGFCFRVDGRSPDVSPSNIPGRLRIELEEAVGHAIAQHNARRKIVRDDGG
jgi:hypothetical protein